MKFFVRVKANAKKEAVEKLGGNNLLLSVRAPAREGLANAAVVGLLSAYLDVAKSRITIIKGQKNRNKVIEVEGQEKAGR